jgi:hypothetical protein
VAQGGGAFDATNQMGVFQQPAGKDVLLFYTDRLKITVIARSTGDEAIP